MRDHEGSENMHEGGQTLSQQLAEAVHGSLPASLTHTDAEGPLTEAVLVTNGAYMWGLVGLGWGWCSCAPKYMI